MGRILVVDDETDLRRTISEALRRAGYATFEASNTCDGLELAVHEQPELIISDICMEGGDGFSLLKSIRSDGRTSNIPFLFMTGHPDWDGLSTMAELAADAYLPKPFSLKTLLKAVEHRLKREEEQKKRAEEIKNHLQVILEVSPDLTGIIDPESKFFLYLNGAGRKILNVPEFSEIEGLAVTDFVSSEAAEFLEGQSIEEMGSSDLWEAESVLTSCGGNTVPVKQFIRAHRDGSGKIAYYSIVAHDLSDVKRREKELKEDGIRFRSLVDALPDAVVTQDDAGNILFSNSGAESLFGYHHAELCGKPFRILFNATSESGAWAEGKPGQAVEVQCVSKSGNAFAAELRVTEVSSSKEKVAVIRALRN